MPKSVLNCTLTANQGKYSFDPVSKLLVWEVGKIDLTKLPNIRLVLGFSLLLPQLVIAHPTIATAIVIALLRS